MNDMESVYYYIASVNPDDSISLLTDKYGYNIVGNVSDEDIAAGLYEIVQSNGHNALVDVMNLHPDKTMILELFAMPADSANHEAAVPVPTIPPLPLGSHNEMGHEKEKPFLSSPTNVMILGIGVIAAIALLKA